MPHINLDFHLSEEALLDFKNIWKKEFDETPDETFLEERAKSLLRFLKILLTPASKTAANLVLLMPTDEEYRALKYVSDCRDTDSDPTARGMAGAIGRTSSRTGAKMLKTLRTKGFIGLTEYGRLGVRSDLKKLLHGAKSDVSNN